MIVHLKPCSRRRPHTRTLLVLRQQRMARRSSDAVAPQPEPPKPWHASGGGGGGERMRTYQPLVVRELIAEGRGSGPGGMVSAGARGTPAYDTCATHNTSRPMRISSDMQSLGLHSFGVAPSGWVVATAVLCSIQGRAV